MEQKVREAHLQMLLRNKSGGTIHQGPSSSTATPHQGALLASYCFHALVQNSQVATSDLTREFT